MSTSGPTGIEGGEEANRSVPEQREPLLRTKLFIPPVRRKRVARPGLIDRLNSGLDKTLILVSAPAGYGKTALLAEWTTLVKLPVAWLSLDEGDNEPYRFLTYVTAALKSAFAEHEISICSSTQALLRARQPVPIQALLVTFINDLTEIPQPFALVLDDYQFITNPAVNEALAYILEHSPPHFLLIIATRADPALPLHRLRSRELLVEIRMGDLRFTSEEAGAFLNQTMELSLSAQDIATLFTRTEGWAAGLQMAALSMLGVEDRSAFIRGFGGSHRFILEYLIGEVLDRQPEGLQEFLLQTSILDRLCGSLCDAVLGDWETGRSETMLEHLDRANLFLTPLDQEGYWYRYHHLFADLLRARLQRSFPERLYSLHQRASQWYEKERLPEEAIKHALASGELERVAILSERYTLEILNRGDMSTLLGLIEALPKDLARGRPALCVQYAWALTFSGRLNEVEPWLREAEERILPDDPAPPARVILGSIAIIRGLIADIQGKITSAIQLARRADELLPKENLEARSVIPFVLGDGYFATGELDKAEQAFEKIKQIGQASGNLWTLAVALHKLALLKKTQGKLRDVWDLYQEAIQLASEKRGQQYGSMGATYTGLSDLLRERNELGAARPMVLQAIEIMNHWPSPTDQVNAYITLARIALSERELERAEEALKQAEKISRQGNIFPITRKTLEACQVRLWLAQEDLNRVARWVKEKRFEEKDYDLDQRLEYVSELEAISMARALIATGELKGALHMLTNLAEAAGLAGRNGRLIEIYNLTALTLHATGKTSQALDVLVKSLELAEPEGYVRVFLDEGRPMEDLILACARRVESPLKAYAEKLLNAFKMLQVGPAVSLAASLQPEPLTGREVEVLRLLAAGLSNQEIAGKLYLSEGTIKTHTHNLYGKLGVQSRTQAIARAKELNLL